MTTYYPVSPCPSCGTSHARAVFEHYSWTAEPSRYNGECETCVRKRHVDELRRMVRPYV